MAVLNEQQLQAELAARAELAASSGDTGRAEHYRSLQPTQQAQATQSLPVTSDKGRGGRVPTLRQQYLDRQQQQSRPGQGLYGLDPDSLAGQLLKDREARQQSWAQNWMEKPKGLDPDSLAGQLLKDRAVSYMSNVEKYGSSQAWAEAAKGNYDRLSENVDSIAAELRGLRLESAYGTAIYQDGIYMGEDEERRSWYDEQLRQLGLELSNAEYKLTQAQRAMDDAMGFAEYDAWKEQQTEDAQLLSMAHAAGLDSEGWYQGAIRERDEAQAALKSLTDQREGLELLSAYGTAIYQDGIYMGEDEKLMDQYNAQIAEIERQIEEATEKLRRKEASLGSASRTRYRDYTADPDYISKIAGGRMYYEQIKQGDREAEAAAQQGNMRMGMAMADNPTAGFNMAMRARQADKSSLRPQDNWTKEEKNTFLYILGSPGEDSKARAEEYAAGVNDRYAMEKKYKQTAQIEEWAGENVLTGTAATAGALAGFLLSPIDAIDKAAEYAATGRISARPYATATDLSNALVSGVKASLNDWSGTTRIFGDERGLGDLYEVAMSVAQSYAAIAAGGGAAGSMLYFFGNGMSNGIDDALSRGAKPGQAMAYGTLSAVAEAVSERFSAESLLSGMNVGNAFKAIAKQAGVEASEEGVSYLLDRFADLVVMGDASQYNTALWSYTLDGMSYDEASKQATKDWLAGLAWSLTSGAFSGALSSSAAQLYVGTNSGTGESPLVPAAQSKPKAEQSAEDTQPSQSPAETAPPEWEPRPITEQAAPITEQSSPVAAEKNKTAPVEGAEALSTYIDTDPEKHSPEQQKVINEYQHAVDGSLKEFVAKVKSLANKTYRNLVQHKISPVSQRAAKDIYELTGLDVSGYENIITGGAVVHIENRHGKNGKQDSSMADVNDIARMKYVLDNYDGVGILTKDGEQVMSSVWKNKDNTPAQMITLYKKLDGTYYIAQAVPDSQKKVLAVQSAFIGNESNIKNIRSAGTVLNVAEAPQVTSLTPQRTNTPDNKPTATTPAENATYAANTFTPETTGPVARGEAEASVDSVAQKQPESNREFAADTQPKRDQSASLDSEEFSISERPERETTAQAVKKARQEERAKAQKKLDKKQEQLDKARARAKALREENKEIKAGMSSAVKTAIQDERTRQAEREKKQQHVKNINKTIESLSRKLSENSGKRHVPENMKKAVAGMLSTIDTRGKRAGWKQQKEFADRMRELALVMSTQQRMQAEEGEQALYLDLPGDAADMLSELANRVERLTEGEAMFGGGEGYVWTLSEMETADLEELDNILSSISKAVEQANELMGMSATVDKVGGDIIREMDGRAAKKSPGGTVERMAEWDMLTPVYFFRRLGKPGEEIFKALRQGWAEFAAKTEQIIEASSKMWSEKEAKDAEKKLIEVELPWRILDDGAEGETESLRSEEREKVRLTHSQAMSLYGLYMRPQGRGHILGAGIHVADIPKNGSRQAVKQDKNYLVTDMDLIEIFNQLSDREREIAKEMSRYMSTVGGEWGNAVTMKRWGIRGYTEETYWPIKTDSRNRDARRIEKSGGESLYRLLNMGFTKPLVKNASNAVEIESAFDVFSGHMVDMAKYNTLALPLLDMMKILNYKQVTARQMGKGSSDESGSPGKYTTASVQKSLDKVYGKSAQRYWMQLMQDLNGDREGGRGMADPFGKLVSNYKAQSVGANLRVAMLQPTSYLRAGAILDGGSMLYGSAHVKGAWAEALKYSGAAKWKNLGYRDSDINANVRELIKHSATALDKARDKGMILAEKADQLTWGALWSASKKSVEKAAERAGKKLSHEELIEQTVERFEEVIYRTQVMDSTLTRSTAMRSTEKFARYATSFMAEPTLSYNMVLDEYANIVQESKTKGFKKAAMDNRKRMLKAMLVYTSTAAASAAMASIVDAMRDDDEYESFAKKWWQAFYGDKFFDGNFAGDLSLVRKIPGLKQVMNLIDGYTSASLDATALSAVFDAWEALQKLISKEENAGTYFKDNVTEWGYINTVLKGLSVLSGLPMASAARDVVAIWNSTYGTWWGSKVQTYDPGAERSIKYAFEDGALTEESARALLVSEGVSDDADAAYWKVEAWKSGDGEYSPYDEVIAAFDARDKTAFENAIDDIEEHGKYRYEIIGKVKEHIQEMQQGTEEEEPSLNKEDAAALLAEYGDMTETAAMEQATKWSCLVETGIDYNQIDDYFYREDINFDKAVELYEKYAPVDMNAPTLTKHEQAVRDVTEMQCYRDTGIKYDNIRYELAEGRITEEQAYQYRLDYDWQHSAEGAANDVLRYVWIGTDYRMNSITAKKVKVYEQYVKDSGVSKYDYYTVFETNPPDSFSSDLEDPNDPYSYVKNSKRDKIWEHIDSLELSPAQKDAMAYAYAGVDADSDGKLTKSWIDVDNAPWNK